MSALCHVVYASEATVTFSDAALGTLLAHARAANEAVGVTGILLLVDTSFFQVLEGPIDAVASVYEKIARDKRHGRVLKLIEEPIAKPDFAEWSMGLARTTSPELAALPGFHGLGATRRRLDTLSEGMARTVLKAFQDGRWRARVGK